ncbi:copper resistance protein CopC [Actinokineospora xionganensis]|uniref:Copper resistance protein CopC n=1 Tax=Actinokineospora xionganensis TaxID=2684470 RepID=A0ABR7L5U7_9PSEU|nr:copper resistance protein CopC [Actinokineospora xionganensis]MBC6448049.1 copper resistance protein CopC [Actinokineospora xionganensis]
MPVLSPSRVRLVFAAFLTALFAMLVNPAPASAHAVLVSSTPGGWQLLGDSPKEVSLRFTESVDVGLATIRLISPRGNEIAGLGAATHPEGKQDTVSVGIPETLANGTYTVSWRVVSADTHPIQGAFTFSVREATAPASAEATAAGNGVAAVFYGVARWLSTAGFALLVGTAFVIAVCWPGARARRGVRRLAVVGAGTATAASVAALGLYGPYASGGSLGGIVDPAVLGATVDSRIGLGLVTRIVLLGVASALLVRFLRRDETADDLPTRQRMRRGILVFAGAGVLAATWSLVAHGAADTLAPLTVPIGLVHLAAIGVWLGGLPAIAVLLRSGDITAMRTAVPRFSTTAGICVLVVAVTGLYQGWRQVGTFAALFGTTYGWWLLGKLALVGLLLGSGAVARRWVHRHYGFEVTTVTEKRRAKRGPETVEVGRFRKVVLAEMALAVALLGVTATLAAAEPARAEQERLTNPPKAAAGPLSVAVPFDAGGFHGKGQVAMVLTPSKVGKNELHLAVLDAVGKPKTVPEVRVELRLAEAGIGPIAVKLVPAGPAHYAALDVGLPMPGEWELAVVVRTSPIDQTTVRVPVTAR